MKPHTIITVCLLSFLSGLLWIVGCTTPRMRKVTIPAPPTVGTMPVQSAKVFSVRESVIEQASLGIPPTPAVRYIPIRYPFNINPSNYVWGLYRQDGSFIQWCDGDTDLPAEGWYYVKGVPRNEWLIELKPL